MPKVERDLAPGADRLFWTRRFSLTARILAVNLIVLGLMGASVIYLDSYRKQLIAERFKLARSEALIIADALAETPRSERKPLLARIGSEQMLRLRLYDAKGRQLADSFLIADEPGFTFAAPAGEPWPMKVIFRSWVLVLPGMGILITSVVNSFWENPAAGRARSRSAVRSEKRYMAAS